MEILANAMQALSIAGLVWAGRQLLESSRLLAVHEERHKRHDERLRLLERVQHAK